MHGGSGVSKEDYVKAIECGVRKINYYSYMAKATSKHIHEVLAENDGNMFWHEVQEEAYRFMREYAREVLTVFKNGK